MTALYPCPLCGQQVRTRLAPSGTVRLTRHPVKDRSKSCVGTGWEVTSR